MKGNFEKALARVLVYEGGNDDDPRDPGGRTSRGIIQREYDAYRRKRGLATRDVWKADQSEIVEIYRLSYWDRVHGDDLPAGVDFVLFDAAVNSGVAQAGKWVQRALGEGYKGAVDGSLGPQTMDAIRNDNDNDLLIDGVLSRRLAMLQGLRTWKHFGKGWAARVSNVKKIGQAWATGSVGPDPIAAHEIGGAAKAVASDVKKPIIPVSIAQVATGASGVSTGIATTVEQLSPVADQVSGVSWLSWLTTGLAILTGVGIVAGIIATVAAQRAAQAQDGSATAEVDDDADAEATSVPVNDNVPPPADGDQAAA